MSTTNQTDARFQEDSAGWQYPPWLRNELYGGFVHSKDCRQGLTAWVFDPDLTGTFLGVRIDSRDSRGVIEPIEERRAEVAFRGGFLEGAREAVADLSPISCAAKAYRRLAWRESEASLLRKYQQLATEVAMPRLDFPRRPGTVVYAIGHWIEGARRRGYHHAWAFVGHDWAYREEMLDGVHGLPNPLPVDISLPMLRDHILPKWLQAVEAWHATPDDRSSPPRPVGKRAGTQDYWSMPMP